MRIAYLFFAYKNPRLMGRVIDRLAGEDSAFFIHVDKKSDIAQFNDLKRQDVYFTPKRIAVYWAEFSGIEAIRLLMQQALNHPETFDYLVLLSGSEYPLKSRDYIHNFFKSHHGDEFMSAVKVPNAEAGKPISRINTRRIRSERPFYRFVVRAMAKLGLAERDFRNYLKQLEPYAGHTWWAMTREAGEYILTFEQTNAHVTAFFEDTFAPEETYFQTILGNSPFGSRLKRNIFFEDWSARGGHPAMINEAHLKAFAQQDKVTLTDPFGSGEVLFARKLSDDTLTIADRLDEIIGKQEGLRSNDVRN
jgi:hypothetical protein